MGFGGGGGGKSSPSITPAPEPDPIPVRATEAEAESTAVRDAEQDRIRKLRGSGGTVLTSPLGTSGAVTTKKNTLGGT